MTFAALVASTPFAAIDASVWISSILSQDSNHTQARNWVNSYISSGGYLVSPLLLVLETGATIARVTQNLSMARNATSQSYSFPYLRLVPLDQILLDEATDIAITWSLKGADALYVAVAKQLSIPLVTFDREQLTRPTNIIRTIKP